MFPPSPAASDCRMLATIIAFACATHTWRRQAERIDVRTKHEGSSQGARPVQIEAARRAKIACSWKRPPRIELGLPRRPSLSSFIRETNLSFALAGDASGGIFFFERREQKGALQQRPEWREGCEGPGREFESPGIRKSLDSGSLKL